MGEKRNLGGWWRLWIAYTVVSGIVVVSLTAAWYPTLEQVPDHPAFHYQMSKEALAILDRPPLPSTAELEKRLIDADRRGAKEEATKLAREIVERRKQPWSGDPIIVSMPNGHE